MTYNNASFFYNMCIKIVFYDIIQHYFITLQHKEIAIKQ